MPVTLCRHCVYKTFVNDVFSTTIEKIPKKVFPKKHSREKSRRIVGFHGDGYLIFERLHK